MLAKELKLLTRNRLSDKAFIQAFIDFGFEVARYSPKNSPCTIPLLVTTDMDIPFAVIKKGEFQYRRKIAVINDLKKLIKKTGAKLTKEDIAVEEFVHCLKWHTKNHFYQILVQDSHNMKLRPVYVSSPVKCSPEDAIKEGIRQGILPENCRELIYEINAISKEKYMSATAKTETKAAA